MIVYRQKVWRKCFFRGLILEQSIVNLYKSLCKIIEERRTSYSLLLNFLKNPNKETDFDKDLDLTLIKSELKAINSIPRFAKDLKKILYHSTSIIASQMWRTLLPMPQKLFDAIVECKAL